MLTAILAAMLLVPQGDRQRSTVTRFLPGDRTVLSLEVPDPALLGQHVDQVFQLQIVELPAVRAMLKSQARNGGLFATLVQKRGVLAKLLLDFDRGIVAANVLPSTRGRRMGICVSGMASKASALREHPQKLMALFRSDPKAKDAAAKTTNSWYGPRPETKIVEQPLADTPVRGYWIEFDQELGPNEWSYWNDSLAFAYKSRQAVFHALNYTRSESKKEVMPLLADLLGIGNRGAKFETIGSPRQLAANERLVARFQLHFSKIRDHKTFTPDRVVKEMSEAGLGSFTGMRSDLIAVEAGATTELREEIELHDGKAEGSVFRVFKPTRFGVREAAALLPTDTIACAKVGFDPVQLQEWSMRVATVNRMADEMLVVFRVARGLAGIASKPNNDAMLEGIDEVVVAIVPPAAGSPVFEPVLVFPVGDRKGSVDTVMKQFIALLGKYGETQLGEKALRRYGKGEDSVAYLRLRDFYPAAATDVDGIGMKLLGGGFLSATEIAGHLFVGCNPKSLKQIKKAHASGDVLAKSPGFAAEFGSAKSRALEIYVDYQQMRAGLGAAGVFGKLIPMFLLGAGPGGGPGGMETLLTGTMTALPDAIGKLQPEVLVADETEYGYRVIRKGGTLLSPVAWAGFAYAASLLDAIANLAR